MDYKVTDTELTSVANVIRTKGGTSGQLTFPSDFITAIENISGGGSKNILGGTITPSANQGNDGDIYIQYTDYTDYSEFPSGYTPIEYISVGSTGGPYIDTGFSLTPNSEYEIDCQYTGTPNSNSWLFGAYQSEKQTTLGYTGNNIYIQVGGNYASESFNLNRHIYKASHTQFLVDNIAKTSSPNWNNTVQGNAWLFHSNNDGNYTNNIKLYGCKIWDDDDLVRNFIPAIRDSDDAIGLYDLVNDVFYTNDGTGSFTAGDELTGTPIDTVYLKVNGSWILLEDGDWDDVNTGGQL